MPIDSRGPEHDGFVMPEGACVVGSPFLALVALEGEATRLVDEGLLGRSAMGPGPSRKKIFVSANVAKRA